LATPPFSVLKSDHVQVCSEKIALRLVSTESVTKIGSLVQHPHSRGSLHPANP
jgi:hypothetical protein